MNLNQLEIQHIRHLVFAASAACDKITYYKTITSDQNVITNFENVEECCKKLKTELSNMLGGN